MWLAIPVAVVAYSLIYAGIKGVHPWCPFLEAFGGTCPPPPGSTSPLAQMPPQGGGAPPPGGGSGGGDGSGSTPNNNTARAQIEAEFPDLIDLGHGVCCKKLGTSGCSTPGPPWSQHAWGNAVDYRVPSGQMAELVAWVTIHVACLGHILPNEPGPGLIHIDFTPQGLGTPPCAGGALEWGPPC